MKLPEFKEFNDHYEKKPPLKVFDDTGIRFQNEIPLPAKYEKSPCSCGTIHDISDGTWYHSYFKMHLIRDLPEIIKIVKKCKKCHEILCLKLVKNPK